MTSFACCAYDDQGKAWSGGANGSVYVWGGDDGRTCEAVLPGTKGKFISAMRFASGKMFSGGKDNKLNCWDTASRTCTMTIDMDSLIRAIDFNGSKLVVGTRDGTIHVGSNGAITGAIMHSHSDGEVWGLDKMADGTIVTSGDDNKVMFWDPQNRKHMKTAKVSDRRKSVRRGASTLSKYPDSQCSRAVAVNNDWLAVAGNDGKVSIRRTSD